MRRKFKLFATVASLCLSVALMAFGVYAATTVNYTVSGSVTYEMNDALVSIATTVTYARQGEAGNETGVSKGFSADETEVPTLSYTGTGDTVAPVQSYDENNVSTTPGQVSDTLSSTVDIDFGISTAWKITINVKTINIEGVEVTLPTTYGVAENSNFVVIADENNSSTEIEKDDTGRDFVFYIYLLDATKSIPETTDAYNIQLSFVKGQA